MALIHRIHELNHTAPNRAYYRFYTNGKAVGFVDTQLLAALDADLFHIEKAQRSVSCHFEDGERLAFEAEIEHFFRNYFTQHNVGGWRDERYAVREQFSDKPVFLIERAALSYLGITGYGVHINGYVENSNGMYLWVAKRSLTKPTAPGKLDQVVAGGVPHGISLMENVIKECEEEASIPRKIAETARPVSAISYHYDLPIGLRPDVIFNYDLALPDDFVPTINDDEVDSFELRPIDDVLMQIAETQDFKFNSSVVIIDFAIRHGIITPDTPDYLALCAGMNLQR